MSTNRNLTPLALAVAALFASPLALAQEAGTSINYNNETNVQLNHQSSLQNAITVIGIGVAEGNIPFSAESGATIDTKQQSVLQTGINTTVENDASVDGNAMLNAEGNAGVNAAAGDNNVQTNDGALSSVDAGFVFANAQSYGYQTTTANATVNTGTSNSANVSGNAFRNFQGNVGLNVAAGNSNAQANAMAASNNNSGSLAKATSYTNQVTSANTTANTGFVEQVTQQVPVSLIANLTGSYAGIADQYGNQYADNWGVCTNCDNPWDHPTNASNVGHTDLDSQMQGAVDRPQPRGLDEAGQADTSTGGGLSFNEAGDMQLRGTVSGNIPVVLTVLHPHVNSAKLGGNAFMGASGNIGVNIASGTNNLQRNSLAIAVAQAAPGGGGE